MCGRVQVGRAVALDQPHIEISVDHEVPAEHGVHVESAFGLLVAAEADHAQDALDLPHHQLPLLLRLHVHEPGPERVAVQHAFVVQRVQRVAVLLDCLVCQVHEFVVVVNVELFRR